MLPESKTKIKLSFNNLTSLLYGPSKIGKSTWCSKINKGLFLSTEPGLNALEVYSISIQTWEDLLSACSEISKGNHDFETIIIDTIDIAYTLCTQYFCKKYNVDHESDVGYGKLYGLINNEFHRVINKLAFLNTGLILVSHSTEIEIDTRVGKKTKIIPTLPTKARKIVTSLVDLILYCDLESITDEEGNAKYERVIRTKPSQEYEAGDRTGLLPETIPLDFNIFSSYFISKNDSGKE